MYIFLSELKLIIIFITIFCKTRIKQVKRNALHMARKHDLRDILAYNVTTHDNNKTDKNYKDPLKRELTVYMNSRKRKCMYA